MLHNLKAVAHKAEEVGKKVAVTGLAATAKAATALQKKLEESGTKEEPVASPPEVVPPKRAMLTFSVEKLEFPRSNFKPSPFVRILVGDQEIARTEQLAEPGNPVSGSWAQQIILTQADVKLTFEVSERPEAPYAVTHVDFSELLAGEQKWTRRLDAVKTGHRLPWGDLTVCWQWL